MKVRQVLWSLISLVLCEITDGTDEFYNNNLLLNQSKIISTVTQGLLSIVDLWIFDLQLYQHSYISGTLIS